MTLDRFLNVSVPVSFECRVGNETLFAGVILVQLGGSFRTLLGLASCYFLHMEKIIMARPL